MQLNQDSLDHCLFEAANLEPVSASAAVTGDAVSGVRHPWLRLRESLTSQNER
jgi:hypothetical protein